MRALHQNCRDIQIYMSPTVVISRRSPIQVLTKPIQDQLQFIIMAGIESQRKFGLHRGRNLPFTLESRKGNYQIWLARQKFCPTDLKNSRLYVTKTIIACKSNSWKILSFKVFFPNRLTYIWLNLIHFGWEKTLKIKIWAFFTLF